MSHTLLHRIERINQSAANIENIVRIAQKHSQAIEISKQLKIENAPPTDPRYNYAVTSLDFEELAKNGFDKIHGLNVVLLGS